MKLLGALLLVAIVVALLRIGARWMNDAEAAYVRRLHERRLMAEGQLAPRAHRVGTVEQSG